MVLAFVAALCLAAAASAAPPRYPEEMLQDAELTDVCFIDPDLGWAVGDRGAILHTDDGGRNWRVQPSPVSCRLESVFFVDPVHGWAAGGYRHPYTKRSTGVVLYTDDGGRRWQAATGITAAGLRRIKFFDQHRGYVVGAASALHPAGVFRSSDGGRDWTPLNANNAELQHVDWTAADFASLTRGAAVGHGGKMALVAGEAMQPAGLLATGPRPLNRLQLSGAMDGWLAGDGGLLLTSGDGGASWRLPPGPLPPEVASQMDFRALATWHQHVWITGAPGSLVLHSPDGGRSWRLFHANQSLPLRGMTFIDSSRGWAVGALGVILATRDGGQTWQRQRSGGERTALLGLYSRAERVPWELLARESGAEGNLSAVEIVCRPDEYAHRALGMEDAAIAKDAASAVGGSSAESWWRLPLRDSRLQLSSQAIVEEWRSTGDRHATAALEELMVKKIRQWRPDVVVTESASPRGNRPLSHIINQVAIRAVQQASDPEQHPQQIAALGLAPWKVKKLLGGLPPDERGAINVATAQLAPRLGCTLADQAARSRALVEDQYRPAPTTLGFRVLVDNLPQDVGRSSLFGGILVREGEARRALRPASERNLRQLSSIAQKRRNIDALLKRGAADSQSGFAWLAQVDNLTSGLGADGAADVLHKLGWAYQRAGRPELTADSMNLLVQRYPDHALSEPALLWLLTYYASGEAAWRERRNTRVAGGMVAVEAASRAPPVYSSTPGQGLRDARQARQDVALGNALPQNITMPRRGNVALAGYNQTPAAPGGGLDPERARQALELGERIQRTRPALFAEPRLRFPLAAAQRAADLIGEAEHFFRSASHSGPSEAWRACAAGELAIAGGRSHSPKSVCRCPRAAEKPRLDGRLDDAVWQAAEPIELKSDRYDDSDWPAVVMIAYDQEFLYLAASCRKAAGIDYAPHTDPRPRDPDQQAFDRIEWRIDIDRDYATFYRLTVDQRGWVGDACLGDASWNPAWHVASGGDAQQWTVEAAIPLEELAPAAPRKGAVWALGAVRIAPRVGFQSWTTPAGVSAVPQGFGWLVFE